MKEILKYIYGKRRSISRFFKSIYWRMLDLGYAMNLLSVYKIPIIINNFNRLTYPTFLIEFLQKSGFVNIVILDNNSTYPPLLQFYESCSHKVVRGKDNYGHLALWKSNLYKKYKWNYFVYTDSDVVPIEECPKNFIEYFYRILRENAQLDKVGFGIKIDDLPDSFSLKKKVVDYEMRYWKEEIKSNIFKAPIDTTFALYRPLSGLVHDEIYTLNAYRFGFPYLIRHLPWYVDSANPTQEEQYYIRTCNSSSSLANHQKGNGSVY